MKIFNGFIKYEWKNFFILKNMVIIGLISIISLLCLQVNINSYKKDRDAADILKDRSSTSIQPCGQAYKMVPPPAGILFYNSGVSAAMQCIVNNDSINIFSDPGDRKLFKKWKSDFSEIILVLGSLLLMLYGASSFKHRNFHRMCNSFLGLFKIYMYTLVSRFLTAFIFFFLLLSAAVVQIMLNGIVLSDFDYLQILRFCLLCIPTLLFFLCLGALTGMLKSRLTVYLLVAGIWFFQIFFCPIAVDFLAAIQQERINKICELKNNHDRAMIRSIDEWERYALVTPATTYMMMTQKMSNQGYVDRLSFYRFVNNQKQKIAGTGQTESIYYSISLMPAHYLRGLLILFLYNLLMLTCGYFVLKRIFYKPKPVSGLTLEPVCRRKMKDVDTGTIFRMVSRKKELFQLDITPGEYDVYVISQPEVVDHIFRHFFGSTIDRVILPSIKQVFICGPEDLPAGVKVIHLLQLMCSLARVEDITKQDDLHHLLNRKTKNLESHETLQLLLALAQLRESELYLFYNTVAGMKESETHTFRVVTNYLRKKPVSGPTLSPVNGQPGHRAIIYLTTDPEIRGAHKLESAPITRNEYWPILADWLEIQTEEK